MSHLYFRCKKLKSIDLIFFVVFGPKGKEQHVWVGERQSGCSPDVSGCFSESWSGLRKDLQTCVKTNNKSPKAGTKTWQELLIFICSLWSNSNTVGVSLFSPSHHPSLRECTVPYCSPGNFSKGARWEENRQKEKDWDKRWRLLFCSGGAKGSAVTVFRKRGFHSSEPVSSSLTVLRALCLSICIISITNTCDIIACLLWHGNWKTTIP